MQSLNRLTTKTAPQLYHHHHLSTVITKTLFSTTHLRFKSTKKNGEDEWNDAWETAWLPEDLSAKNRAPWETDVHFSSAETIVVLPSEFDSDTKAFVEDMTENWDERRRRNLKTNNQLQQQQQQQKELREGNLYSVENMKKDYRLKKQRIHAGLWMKEIEKQEEAKFGGGGGGDDIERLLDSCSEIFDSTNNDLNESKIPSTSEFKTKPDGWETTSKVQDGNLWEISQREEDILLQEFERRIAFSKFQIASFIKSHIFSRRRPIDGWKYMIEVIGPNAKKGKGSVSRLPNLSDSSTQPFKEEKTPMSSSLTPFKRR
ncbi:hypothetical protein BVC80_9097g111 [Macleaya cordata]|uniref:Mucin-like protein n=1 Tax=Macleaya cordata TaxID=56857 RepID=A0A200QF21_MACCD|nr:hypothetical protein BVC80_9097g111 [Macleaya cordata]